MTEHDDQYTHDVMMQMPENWRYYWCSGGPCACMGGANCAGRAAEKGITHEQWAEWVKHNPNPNPPTSYGTIEDVFRAMK